MRSGGRGHVHQFGLIGRGSDHQPRDGQQAGNIESTVVGLAVCADEACPVEHEAHRQVLDRHVVDELVVGALHEGRVDRHERLQALAGLSGGEGHGVLLGDTDVVGALGEVLAEAIQPRARWHGGGDGRDAFVLLCFADQRVGEHAGEARRIRDGLVLLAGDHVEAGDAVVFVGSRLGRSVALALLRDHVDEERPAALRVGLAHVFQHGQQVVEVVAVDRADVVEAQLFEQGAAGGVGPGEAFPALGGGLDRAREPLGDVLGDVAQALIGAAGRQAGEIRRHGANRRRDAHVIVVEDHGQAPTPDRSVVHRLVGHARRHGAVADHRDHLPVGVTALVHALGHTQCGGDRGRRMGGSKGVVFALRPAHEARQPVFLAQAADAIAAFGQDFVRVGLVPHVPDQPVVGGVEDPVQRDGQLDHAQTGTQMPARSADRVDQFGAQFIHHRRQRLVGQRTQILGPLDLVQRWGLGAGGIRYRHTRTRCGTGNRPGLPGRQLRTGIGLNGGGLAQIPPEKTGMPVPHHCH